MSDALNDVDTPAAVVDVDRVHANFARVAAYCRTHDLAWRPHAKTHKTAALAAEQVRAGAVGVTVATLREAEVMASTVDDLLLAYPQIGVGRVERLAVVAASVPHLCVAVDSIEALASVAAAARAAGREVDVLVEIDAGMRRAGAATPEAAVALARDAAETRGVGYRGVMFYPGHIRAPLTGQDAALAALSARLAAFLEALSAAGLPPAVVSGGSTPTLWRSHEVAGVTEIRPGIDIFHDRTSASFGACAWDGVAFSVLATVVSTGVPGQAVVDAGSKALAREQVPGLGGFACVLDRPEVVLRAISEEHGILDLGGSDWRPRLGERVRLVPNHVCVAVNLHDELVGVRGGDVIARWPVEARGWRRYVAAVPPTL